MGIFSNRTLNTLISIIIAITISLIIVCKSYKIIDYLIDKNKRPKYSPEK